MLFQFLAIKGNTAMCILFGTSSNDKRETTREAMINETCFLNYIIIFDDIDILGLLTIDNNLQIYSFTKN